MDWSGYYNEQAGRSLRPVLHRALELRGDRGPGTAIDLGCGEGTETRYLLRTGWRVHAFDADPESPARVGVGLPPAERERLHFTRAHFELLPELPPADLINSCFALPFCDPAAFPALWRNIRSALAPGAWFSGELFGPRDSWAGRADMTFHPGAAVEKMLEGLTVHSLVEDDHEGESFAGPKHWHIFHVVAERPEH